MNSIFYISPFAISAILFLNYYSWPWFCALCDISFSYCERFSFAD